jgi:hypothetical protein
MSQPTEHFGIVVIRTLRNIPLRQLDSYLGADVPEDIPEDLKTALGKLDDQDKLALRRMLANSVDEGISSFLYTLDELSHVQNGLRINYENKPLTYGDYAFKENLQKWRGEFDEFDDAGNRKDDL